MKKYSIIKAQLLHLLFLALNAVISMFFLILIIKNKAINTNFIDTNILIFALASLLVSYDIFDFGLVRDDINKSRLHARLVGAFMLIIISFI
jgi:nitrogen fixation/metabolism regulation signal transduction histidine kinase